MDAAVSRQITRNWTILMKAAFFDGSAGLADRTKLWLQTEFSF